MTDQTLAAYIAKLERALRSLPADERHAIIAEIKSHIDDRTVSTGMPLDDTLEKLGDPLELAQAYLDQRKLEDAVVRSAHGTLLITILERAGRSVAAALIGLCAVSLYLCAIVFAAMAVLKPILPQQVGLWFGPHMFAFAIMDHPPTNATELLGYSIIPVSLVLGVLSFLIGRALTRFGGRVLLRKSQALPG
jgi:uncharacterized membrane protein